MQKNRALLDIYVNSIDNYGDIGFVSEFLLYFQKQYPNRYQFRILTNDTIQIKTFFQRQWLQNTIVERYYENFTLNNETVCIALSFLHADFPIDFYTLVLRIDYISLDTTWLTYNEREHIHSTESHKIIEIIPGPLSSMLPKVSPHSTKAQIAKKFWFKPHANWFIIFAYSDTIENIVFAEEFLEQENIEVLIFWNSTKISTSSSIHTLGFLDIESFYTILSHSVGAIVRGEISFMQILRQWKPFLWDIYHSIGGFPEEQSKEFLAYIQPSREYSDIQVKLWWQERIDFCDIYRVLLNTKEYFTPSIVPNICEEIKKYIDTIE